MIDLVKSWVVNIVTLVMLIILLEMLVPSGKLKKMISLVTGFILIIAIITPILGFLKKGGELKDIQISQTTFLEQKDLEASARNLSKKQSAIIVTTYKNKLIKDVEENLKTSGKFSEVKADVMVEENSKSDEFGMIRKITVSLKEKEKENLKVNDPNGVKPVIAIQKVNIGNSIKDEASPKKDNISEETRNDVKKKLSQLYNLNLEQISVSGL